MRPRIDIDNQISEANRVSAVLRRVAQAAKSTAKNGTRAKQRLVRKAGKVSSEDLERIAVLKRCGLFNGESIGRQTSSHAGGSASSAKQSLLLDNHFVHGKISAAMPNIPGASDLFHALESRNASISRPSEVSSAFRSSFSARPLGAEVAGCTSVIVAQPLPPASRADLLANMTGVYAAALNTSEHSPLKHLPTEEYMDEEEAKE
jgi:hypothetical protein